MDELNVPKPKRIDVAVPANQSSGLRHDAGSGDGTPVAAQGYAGNLPPQQAYEIWQKGEGVLVDVRTDAEREWVGFIPGAANVVWKQWPGMKVNAEFDEQIRKAVPPGKKALMMCRSGVRSAAAAKRATELGIESYNVLEGFEGDPDENGQRGKRGGWRMRGLPWRQG